MFGGMVAMFGDMLFLRSTGDCKLIKTAAQCLVNLSLQLPEGEAEL